MIKSLNNGGSYDELEIQVNYSLGGINYFSGNHNPRGYYLQLSPCKVNITELSDGEKFSSRQYSLMSSKEESGFKVLIETTKRKSTKRLKELTTIVEGRASEIRDLFEQRKYNDVFVLTNQRLLA